MEESKIKVTKEVVDKLLNLLGVEGKIEVAEDKSNEAILVQIELDDPGVLIGYHGQTLSSLQLILGIIISKKINEWTRIIVNVGDYRQKREETLRKIAFSAAQRAHFSGESVVLDDLSSSDRRVVHLLLSNHPDVETHSEGEGQERKLIVRPRAK